MVAQELTIDRQNLVVTGWTKNATHTIFNLLGGGTYAVPNNQWTLSGDDDLTNDAEDQEEKAEEDICKTQDCENLPATQLLKLQVLAGSLLALAFRLCFLKYYMISIQRRNFSVLM